MNVYHLIPLLPVAVRLFFAVAHKDILGARLTPSEKNIDSTRTMIIGLAGLSFAGIVAITVISKEDELRRLETAMFFLLMSFLAYFFALSVQGYKNWLFVDMISDALMDVGGLALLGFVVFFLKVSNYDISFQSTAVFVIALGWLIDFTARLIANHKAYSNWKEIHKRS